MLYYEKKIDSIWGEWSALNSRELSALAVYFTFLAYRLIIQ